ncbi:phytanoyl-CoA dioxygenase family protein [Candidatus Pelagibacter sp.]|nr:phytanoyl-CoA dioxygenase family protein [Candidatus Pelagibacter sp.]
MYKQKTIKILKDKCIYYSKKYKNVKKPRKSKHKLTDPSQDQIVYNLQNKDYIFIKCASHKKILKIVKKYFNESAYGKKEEIIFHQLTGRNPKSFKDQQTLHIDSRLPGLQNPIKVVVTIMLDDFTKKNGATRLIPGSHLTNRFPKILDEKSKKIKYIEGKLGDVIIMDAGLWHAGSANKSKNSRWSILVTYARWYFKQAFDMPNNLPNKIFKKCKKPEKKLLGFYSIPPKNEFDRINALKK